MNPERPSPDFFPKWTLLCVCVGWTIYLSVGWVSDMRVPTTLMQRVSWDEYQYLPHIKALQDDLRNGNLAAFFATPESFGYGDLFWQLYAAATIPVAKLVATDNPLPIIWLRYLTLFFQLGSVVVSIFLLRHLTGESERTSAQRTFLLLVAPMPGVMLLYKPFSPDYLAMFLLLCGLLFAQRDVGSGHSSTPLRIGLAAALIGAGLATKAYNALLLPVFVICTFRYRRPSFELWPQVSMAAFGGLGGFLAANTSIFATGLQPFVEKFRRLSALMNSDIHPHAIHPTGILHRLLAWWDNPNTDALVGINTAGFAREFVPSSSLVCVVMLVGVGLWRAHNKPTSHSLRPRVTFLACGLVAILVTALTTNRVWTWYLLSPVIILMLGIAACVSPLGKHRNGRIVLIGAVALHLFLLLPRWSAKLTVFLHYREISIAEFQDYYRDVVAPYRPIIDQLPKGAVLAHYRAPIEPVETNLLWSNELRDFLKPETRLISIRNPTDADRRRFLELGFTETEFSGGYSIFLAPGLAVHTR